jgi:hypothetical protein
MGVSIDRSLATAKGTRIYTFKAHGQIYHRLDQLMPGVKGPRHMCNTPGVCHSLSSGFELKHDRLSGDEPNLNLDIAPLPTYRLN